MKNKVIIVIVLAMEFVAWILLRLFFHEMGFYTINQIAFILFRQWLQTVITVKVRALI